ncbi:MAG: hypothetical protein HS108_13775 [Planctomycetes bacterium]|nr:hypothetical protein [Planctomycetota bacterium]MCL4730895.1 hypothetical protein [Planctomycetota bacterium]
MGRVAPPSAPVQPARPDPTKVPSWAQPTKQTLENAALEKRPIVLFFQGEGAEYGDFYVYGDDYAALARDNAVFMRIPYNENRDKPPASDSPIPVSKLLSDNPARDYGVPVGKPLFVVADWYGNSYFRSDRKPSAAELKQMIEKVPAKVEDSNKKLAKTYESAKAAWDKSDRTNALKALLKNFKEDVVGLEAQENSIRLYHEIMDATRNRMKELHEKGDVEGLKGLAKEVKGTEVAKEVDAVIKAPVSRKTQEGK